MIALGRNMSKSVRQQKTRVKGQSHISYVHMKGLACVKVTILSIAVIIWVLMTNTLNYAASS